MVNFTVGDLDSGADGLVVTATSNNQTLVLNANLVSGGSGGNRNLPITPVANGNGAATITVRVTDPGGLFAEDTFLLTVNPINDAPTFTLGAGHSSLKDAGPQTMLGFATDISAGPPNESSQTLVGFTVTQTASTGGLTFSTVPAMQKRSPPSEGGLLPRRLASVSARKDGSSSGADVSAGAQTAVAASRVQPPTNTPSWRNRACSSGRISW